MQNSKKAKLCYLCGKEGADSKDHVPPKGIFPKRYRQQLMTVPAHIECNAQWQQDDELIRNFIAIACYNNPQMKLYWKTHIKRSFIRNPGARLELLKRMRPVWAKRPFGLGAIRTQGFQIEDELIQREVRRWYKGIHYKKFNKPFSDKYQTSVQIWPNPKEAIQEFHEILSKSGIKPIWKRPIPDVFSYCHMSTNEDDEGGICIFVFFNSLVFFAVSGPDDVIED